MKHNGRTTVGGFLNGALERRVLGLVVGALLFSGGARPPAVEAATLPTQGLPGSSSAAAALKAFAAAWSSITAYSATVTVFDQLGARTQDMVVNYTFRKPSTVTVDMVSGPNAGVNLSWNGGTTVIARRGSGLASMFSRTIPLHDPLVTTLRGSSIDQLSFGAILGEGQKKSGDVSEIPADAVNGIAVEALALVPSEPANNGGLTREMIYLSSETHLPVRILGYEGLALVRKIDFTNVRLQN